MISENLVKLGLTHNEAETYLYLVNNYKAKASEIAKFLNVTHPAAKKILDSLLHKKLIRTGQYGKTTFYFPENSNNLVAYSEEQAEITQKQNIQKVNLAKNIHKLLEIKSEVSQDNNTEIEFYMGKSGANIVAQKIASAKNKTVYEFYDRDLLVYSKNKDKIEHKKLFEKNNINFEVIFTSSNTNSKSAIQTNETKLDKSKITLPSAEMTVFDDTVSFSYIDDDIKFIVIKNQHIANSVIALITNLKTELENNN